MMSNNMDQHLNMDDVTDAGWGRVLKGRAVGGDRSKAHRGLLGERNATQMAARALGSTRQAM